MGLISLKTKSAQKVKGDLLDEWITRILIVKSNMWHWNGNTLTGNVDWQSEPEVKSIVQMSANVHRRSLTFRSWQSPLSAGIPLSPLQSYSADWRNRHSSGWPYKHSQLSISQLGGLPGSILAVALLAYSMLSFRSRESYMTMMANLLWARVPKHGH